MCHHTDLKISNYCLIISGATNSTFNSVLQFTSDVTMGKCYYGKVLSKPPFSYLLSRVDLSVSTYQDN